MDESHFELDELDGERWCPEVVVVRACSCAAGRVVKEEFDGDNSCLIISYHKNVRIKVIGVKEKTKKKLTGVILTETTAGLSASLTSSQLAPSSPVAPR